MENEFREFKKACIDKNISLSAVAKKIGCSRTSLYKFLNRKSKYPIRFNYKESIEKILQKN